MDGFIVISSIANDTIGASPWGSCVSLISQDKDETCLQAVTQDGGRGVGGNTARPFAATY